MKIKRFRETTPLPQKSHLPDVGLDIFIPNDFEIKPPPDYREILKQHGIDVGEMSDEELQKLIKELQNGTSN